MAWYSDYHTRREGLERDGLLVLVRGARIDPDTGFVALYLEANECDLLRSNVDRGFDLHVTLGYTSDYTHGVAHDAVDRINLRWRGRLVRLRVGWVGGGGSIQLSDDDPFACDPDIWWLQKKGHYGNGVNCLPRGLHVSL